MVISPFGAFGGRRRPRGYYPGYDPRFDPRYGRGYGGGTTGTRAQRALLAVIASYRTNVSAARSRPVCRFEPSCSAYAAEAITRYGAVGGARRALGRLLRCRPGTAGGHDPVPVTSPL